MKTLASDAGAQPANAVSGGEAEKKRINGELWKACAGPLVNLPAAGTHVFYFPQGHSEQVAASMKKNVEAQMPNYPNLPSKLLCLLHDVTLHADPETDEVYAQMTLQPVTSFDKEALLRSDMSMRANKLQTEFFCKTLTASDTSTHGGFSVPRRAAEKIFPPLDFTMQPPVQELVARDLHDNIWKFRHIYRGQPKRHLLTTGWSLFVSGKRLCTGDSVLFIRDEKQHLLLGIRRANRQPTNISSSVLSSDNMHYGILAAAAHAAANNSPFTVFYNPRASPSEFEIPLAKYYKAVCSNQISPGMRFRMMFETEESGTRRYMGTITAINDLDPVRWKNSQWRNLLVGWDESTGSGMPNRVSIWEIEPVTAPFFICPSPSFFHLKRPRQPGIPENDGSELENLFRRTMPWIGDEFGLNDPQALPGLSLVQWMNMQQNSSLANSMQPNYISPLCGSSLQNLTGSDASRQFSLLETQNFHWSNLQFNAQRPNQPIQQLDQLQKLPSTLINPLGSSMLPLTGITEPRKENLVSGNLATNQVESPYPMQTQNVLQQQQSLPNHQLPRNLPQHLPRYHHQILSQAQQQNSMPSLPSENVDQQFHTLENQTHVQFPQNQLLHIPQKFYGSMPASQMQVASQSTSSMPMMINSCQTNPRFAQPSQQSKLHQQQEQSVTQSELPGHEGHIFNSTNNQSTVTGYIPSYSTSPSTNSCPNGIQPILNGMTQQSTIIGDEIAQSSCSNLAKDLEKRADAIAMPMVNTSKSQNQGFYASESYLNGNGGQIDNLDSSSSATSILSQNDGQIQPNNKSLSFNSQSMLFKDASLDGEPQSNISSGPNIGNKSGLPVVSDQFIAKNMVATCKNFQTNLSSGGGMLSNPEEAQPELSSSIVSQSFGVLDMTFNSMDSTMNDDSFMNGGAWAPPQMPRMRTYTKVYKRGAVGRSIDITRYSGYDELKQDLARRFGIEGQLEEQQRIGWKLVYVDHENDVLLVGDDPWEEFLNCVRCIKILSPQEVQQMSLVGDFGGSITPNLACSSSDGRKLVE